MTRPVIARKPRASKGSAGTATNAGDRRWGNAPGPPRRGLRDHRLQPLHFRIHQIARIAIRVTPIDRTLLFRSASRIPPSVATEAGQIEPKARVGSENPAEAKGRIRGHVAAAARNVADAVSRDSDVVPQGPRREAPSGPVQTKHNRHLSFARDLPWFRLAFQAVARWRSQILRRNRRVKHVQFACQRGLDRTPF
jgi:hypothetical protein